MSKLMNFTQIIGNDGVFIDGDWIESKDQDKNGDVRLIQLADIGDGKFINKSHRYLTSEKAKELRCTYLKSGDVLVARMPDPLGRSCVFPGLEMPCVTVVDVCIIRPDPKIVLSEWLAFQINSPGFRNKIQKYITGTTRQRISRGNLSRIEFVVPTIEIQQRTLKMLKKANSISDKRKLAISLMDQYLKSVFLEMFGDPVINPKNWDTIEFSKACLNMFGGGTPSKSNPDYYIGNIPWVTPKDMKFRYISNSIDHISDEAISHSSTKLVPANSVLMVIRSGILKNKLPVAINMIDVTINQDMKAYVINPQISNPHFVLFFFETYEKHLLEKVRAVTADNLKFDDIKSIKMFIPPMEMQEKFSHIASETEAIKKKMLRQLVEVENQFNALMQKEFNH